MGFRFRQETAVDAAGSTCHISASHTCASSMERVADRDPFRVDIRVYGDGGWTLPRGRHFDESYIPYRKQRRATGSVGEKPLLICAFGKTNVMLSPGAKRYLVSA